MILIPSDSTHDYSMESSPVLVAHSQTKSCLPSCPLSSNMFTDHIAPFKLSTASASNSGLYDALIFYCVDLVARGVHEQLVPISREGREELICLFARFVL
ncbi:hypothetical protein AZE42_13163 [Rhizopogon vesiculosus]|uniref:Uncharacterized protein n=1 Tax=Rhizopogon vesiculosus TaxID=180088 RepID=A0A1J8QNU5_9AGAM|nr:hypothetical protein AZE42_13163 [Rhizopogon vesiculosus]